MSSLSKDLETYKKIYTQVSGSKPVILVITEQDISFKFNTIKRLLEEKKIKYFILKKDNSQSLIQDIASEYERLNDLYSSDS
jgi:ABC-type Zn uptake system ZnuABC Zn-binding protein ZnuA